jgi:hypothetical protein
VRLSLTKIGKIGVIVSLLMGGAGGVFLSASAANAAATAARPSAAVRHVSPFGVLASRSARHISKRPGAAAAVTPSVATLWVSNTAPPGSNVSCASPGYSSISGALAVAPSGAVIKVCTGTYPDQLAITQSVTIKAVGSVTVLGPVSPADNLTGCDVDGGAQPNQDVVDICGTGVTGAVSVTITGLTIQGNWPADVCNDSLYGVAVLGAAHLTMSATTVEDTGGNPLTDGCQGGVGIEVGLATSATAADSGTATLTNDTVTSYQKNGITVDGAGSNAKITGTTVTGAGPSTATAQNGIQVSDGATSAISGSIITGNECNDTNGGCGPSGFSNVQSAGILAFDSGKTTVSNSTVSGNDIGVYNVEDYTWAYYTPATPFVQIPVTFTTLTLANRYENATFDQGKSTITSSGLSGGEVGIEEFQYNGQTTSPVVTATSDTITGASGDAILVASDGVSGDKAVKLTATMSTFGTSNAGGVSNQSTSLLTVTNDWWGDTTGPSSWSFGSGSSVSSDVNFFPWATDAGFSGQELCTMGTSVTTSSNDVVLCAPSGASNAFLRNAGTGNVLLIGNKGNDQLVGSSSGETWMIGGNPGHNTFNGSNGTGFIQERGNPNDTLVNTSGYTVAPS